MMEDTLEMLDDPGKITEAMRAGLARMYADKDFHSYLLHSIQMANKGVMICVKKGELEKARTYADRLEYLKTMVNMAKDSFVTIPKLKEERLEELKNKEEQHD